MDQSAHGILRFSHFALDLTRGCLRSGDQEVALRPKAFEVLPYLAQNAGRLIPKEELYDAVWPKVTVSDDSIAQCIRELRDKLGDDNHSLIKTVSRRGYLLNAVVTAEAPDRLAVVGPEGLRTQLGALQRASIVPEALTLRSRACHCGRRVIGIKQDMQVCLDDENSARDQVVKEWNQFSSADHSSCLRLTTTGGNPTYTEYLTCLEMDRDAKKLPQEGTVGLSH